MLLGDGGHDPMTDQVTAQSGQRPAGAGLAEITGTGEGDVADPFPNRIIEPPRVPAPGRRVPRTHPVGVELADHSTDLILIGLEHPGDVRGRHTRVRRQQNLRPLAQGEHLRLARHAAKPNGFVPSQLPHEDRRRASHTHLHGRLHPRHPS